MGREIKYVCMCSAVASRHSLWRSIERLITSNKFYDLYTFADEEGKQKIEELVEKGDLYGLKQYLKTLNVTSIEEMTIRELRALAQKYHVPNYSRLQKLEIIRKLKRLGVPE